MMRIVAGVSLFLLPFTVQSFVTPSFTSSSSSSSTTTTTTTTAAEVRHQHQVFAPRYISSPTSIAATVSSSDNPNDPNDGPIPMHQQQKYNISLLLIDHYDSFTYNLYDMLAQLTVEPPQVIAKDALSEYNVDDWKHVVDGIILSPGPGTPQEQPPLSHQSISKNPNLPILGVCLGHQLLALAYGGDVGKAPKPIHGQDHWISSPSSLSSTNGDNKLFQNLPPSFRVVRYHSLAAYNLPKDQLEITATSPNDNVIQGIQHVSNPHFGVQFHPESIGSQYGMELLNNFCKIVQDYKMKTNENDDIDKKQQQQMHQEELTSKTNTDENVQIQNEAMDESESEKFQQAKFRVLLHPLDLDISVEPRKVFSTFFANRSTAMWLDSSSYPSRGELDIMAAPLSADDFIEYHLPNSNKDKKKGNNNNYYYNNRDILTQLEEKLSFAYDFDIGFVSRNLQDIEWTKDTTVAKPNQVVFERGSGSNASNEQQKSTAPTSIPFDYRGGYLGYLGYEVRHDTQRYLQEQESCPSKQHSQKDSPTTQKPEADDSSTTTSSIDIDEIDFSSSSSSTPTAAFFLARESMIYHHPTQQWYLLGLVESEEDVSTRMDWIKRTTDHMAELSRSVDNDDNNNDQFLSSPSSTLSTTSPSSSSPRLAFVPNRPKERYAQDISKCHEFIEMGESYELCLTNQLEATVRATTKNNNSAQTTSSSSSSPTWDLYQELRRKNPAPYSAYFQWKNDLAICCSSPERFMSVQRRATNNDPYRPSIVLQAEAKPIKGTCARVMPGGNRVQQPLTEAERREDERRARSLELSLKNRAENLMIVDLLRNDMSRVCQIGSVHVAKLMDIESFATVHQMVSTIRGTLASSSSSISSGHHVNGNKKTKNHGTVDLLRASFPGGSMTGAPKIRTMELLEELEDNVDRGPYSGSLGYLSINGCMDMNIIIRSAVVVTNTNNEDRNDDTAAGKGRENYRSYKISIGAGGAITALSEIQDEYDEMLLKARAVVEAVQQWASTISSSSKEEASTSNESSVMSAAITDK